MLRIKKDVDLEELEKFGFKYKEETEKTCEVYEKNTKQGATIIFIWSRGVFCQDLDAIYDLIQANLVEKVEE